MSYLIKYIKNRIYKKNKNFLAIICGSTGSGKSTAALAIAEALDSNFNIDNVVFNVNEFMDLLNSAKLKKGAVIIWDEAGVGMPSREWYAISNKAINYVLQTFRHLNLVVLFTTPDFNFIDSQSRRLFHAYFETIGINYEEKINTLKLFLIQNNPKISKVYYKYARILTKEGIVTLNPITINLPTESLLNSYEEKKKEFTTWLNQSMAVRIKKIQVETKKKDVLTCKQCRYRWVYRSINPPERCPKCRSRRWDEAKIMQIMT